MSKELMEPELMEKIDTSIYEYFEEYQKVCNLPITDVYKMTGINYSVFNNIKNKKRVPSLGTVIKIADGLGVSIDDLIGRTWSGSDGSGDFVTLLKRVNNLTDEQVSILFKHIIDNRVKFS